MKKIDGKEKNLRSLLQNQQYTIQYYQREYRWGTKQIEELLSDLTEEFLNNYQVGDDRKAVKNYGCYYLGSVIRTNPETGNAIIDGQQRLTSITLLLIYLNNLQKNRVDKVAIDSLIYSESYGQKSFNLYVPEREECLNALYNQKDFNITDKNDSIKNIYNRYKDIESNFIDDLTEEALPYFIDWLIDNVYLVDIVAYTEQDAHKIFVTMNDRGLSLTPAEMLKGYLLSEITDNETRDKANQLWKSKINELNQITGDENKVSEDFIKNLLRAQYAQTIRENKKGATPQDFDLIGTEFHRWIHDNTKKIGLIKPLDYSDFILEIFPKYADIYIKLLQASNNFDSDYEYVYYNAQRDFTLQYQLILSAISKNDNEDIIKRKIQVVSQYIDIYITNRITNYKTVNYSTIKNAIFNLTKRIRNLEIDNLKKLLIDELDNMEYKLTNDFQNFALNNYTSRYIRHILARITTFIENCCDVPQSSFVKYIDRNRNNGYDIEHIIADDYNAVSKYFDSDTDFKDTRNKLGNLILLPADKNRSIQDLPYEKKLDTYSGENILAKSLCESFYSNNPRFLKLIKDKNINFTSIKTFNKSAIYTRQKIYEKICQLIWDSSSLNNI